ncbi:type II CRISPR-associated endonuclease Cas1 [Staphylococcus cornubiensis]|uniref:type II CRISPR-associated endonuclease Cas1 n=1 Tax=Staphylococcus cornubiensis TaxID=1986155 RepID=UPI000A3B8873|nr:type II CRISPR-associated endonuclease Cas1 [Staphylococcus cornubiensis]
MSFRTVIITKESKLSLRMNQLIVKNENLSRIPLNEILCLVIEHPNVSMTGHLMNALSDRKIVTILCNTKHLPNSLLLPLFGHHRQARHIQKQINWQNDRKAGLWQLLIKHKILNQKQVVQECFKESNTGLFDTFANSVALDDSTNREGHAAKVYFNIILDSGHARGDDSAQNAAMDYGYQVLLAIVARTIVSKGYLTELGIKHHNEFNVYNLASDFMEIFRPIIDYLVLKNVAQQFGTDQKRAILNILNIKLMIDNRRYYFMNAVEIYVDSLFKYLSTGDKEAIKIPTWTY